MVAPTADPELARLLDEYGQAEYEFGRCTRAVMPMMVSRASAARGNLLDYVAAHYIRRDRLYPDPLDDPEYLAALEAPTDNATRGYQAARGVVPWRPGDELPEDAIRRLRDGEAARDPSARATLARLDAMEDKIRARMTPAEYDEFCRARAEVFDSLEEAGEG